MAVRTTDGRTIRHEILHRRGSPDTSVGWPEVEEKFRSITRALLGPEDQDRVCILVRDLDRTAEPAAALEKLCQIAARPLAEAEAAA